MNQPLLSIVTVVYNDVDGIEFTIKSVVDQSYKNIEYIIIDGGSTDGTVEVIKQYESGITLWQSEPDAGIYDAMNKALGLITGEYVWFLNSGDEIFSKDVVENFNLGLNHDCYYGKTALISLDRTTVKVTTVPEKLNWKSMANGMAVSHQSIIFSTFVVAPYECEYTVVSDHDWIISALKKCKSICNTNATVSKYLLEGFSQDNFMTCWKERFSIVHKHYSGTHYLKNILSFIVALGKKIIKKLINNA